MACKSGNLCARVRAATREVAAEGQHVRICPAGVQRAAEGLSAAECARLASPHAFDSGLHFVDGTDWTAQYLLCVDAINFCFWPDAALEYEHLAGGLKAAVEAERGVLAAERLQALDGAGLQALLGWPRPLPLQAERARLLNEVGAVLAAEYEGRAANLVRAAGGSAPRLAALVAARLPGFQDHAIHRGRQVPFMKRAQIFVGDVYGAYQGRGLGEFHDIRELTTFADYRVPALLREEGILAYAPPLAAQVDGQGELRAGSEEEVAIRACTIEAVEQLKAAIAARLQGTGVRPPHSLELDWWLWERGEARRGASPPHHRCRTIYY